MKRTSMRTSEKIINVQKSVEKVENRYALMAFSMIVVFITIKFNYRFTRRDPPLKL